MKNKTAIDTNNLEKALAELASKSGNFDKFLKNLLMIGDNFGIDINSQKFKDYFKLTDGDAVGNKMKMKKFYLGSGMSAKRIVQTKLKSVKEERKKQMENRDINNIISLAYKLDATMNGKTNK